MAKKQKMQMPQSTAGLVRYFDESQERFKFKPEHIAVGCAIIIALELILKLVIF